MISKKNNQSKFIKSLANKKLGIIGGGQLGKMIAIAASRLGIKTIIYDPDKYATAFQMQINLIVIVIKIIRC